MANSKQVTIVATAAQAVEWAQQCKVLQAGVRARMATVRRKKSWAPSIKAVTLADMQQQDEVLAQMQHAIAQAFGNEPTETPFRKAQGAN